MSDTDTVTLSFPREARYYRVARLVVGGIAAPLQMSLDSLDDLQMAIDTLLDSEDLPNVGELTLQLESSDMGIRASLGTFSTGSLAAAFERSAGSEGGEFGLRKLLDTIVDTVEVDARDGGEWVSLTKRVKAAAV